MSQQVPGQPVVTERPLHPVTQVEKAPAAKPVKDEQVKVEVKTEVKEEPKIVPAPKDETAKRFALLAQKERAIRARESRVTEESKSLESTKEQLSHIKDDPLGTVEKLAGKSFKELADLNLKRIEQLEKEGKDPNKDPKLAEIEAKMQKMEAAETARQEKAQQEEVQARWNTHLNECSTIVQKDPEGFETILADTDEATQVYSNLFIEFFKFAGRDPVRSDDPEQDEVIALLKRTEEVLEEQVYKRFTRYEPLKKVQTKYAAWKAEQAKKTEVKSEVKTEEPPKDTSVADVVARHKSKRTGSTITSKLTGSGAGSSSSDPYKGMTKEQRIAAISKKFS
jgi:hypothetical protein